MAIPFAAVPGLGCTQSPCIRGTMTQTLRPISAATPTEAHRLIESGKIRGKIVIEGFPNRGAP